MLKERILPEKKISFRNAEGKNFDSVHELMYQVFEKHLLRRPDIYREGNPFTFAQFILYKQDKVFVVS